MPLVLQKCGEIPHTDASITIDDKTGLSLVKLNARRPEVQICTLLDPVAVAHLLINDQRVHFDHLIDGLVRTDVVQAQQADKGPVRGGLGAFNAERLQNDSLIGYFARNYALVRLVICAEIGSVKSLLNSSAYLLSNLLQA